MKDILKKPIALCALVAVVAVFMLFIPGMGAFIGGGALLKAFTALVAGAVLMGLVWMAKRMQVLFNKGESDDIKNNPLARAVLLGALYISFALVVASIFG